MFLFPPNYFIEEKELWLCLYLLYHYKKKGVFKEVHLGIVDTDKTCDREEWMKMNTQRTPFLLLLEINNWNQDGKK